MRPLCGVLLTKPFETLFAMSLFVLGIAMNVHPTILEHTPIGFETRGVIHHLWHYSLIVGGGLTLIGLFWNHPASMKVEFPGLVIMFVAVAENTIALLTDSNPVGGLEMAFRFSVLIFLIIRCYALLTQPVVYVLRAVRDE